MSPKITQWAIRHGVSAQALHELDVLFGTYNYDGIAEGKSEAYVQSQVRLEAGQKGVRLFRNNVGQLFDDKGRPVRYGLANDSKLLNERIKSADLIGWRSVIITPQHVGSKVAQIVSRECKEQGWKYSGSGRERAQLAWAQLINKDGGDASFCTGKGTL